MSETRFDHRDATTLTYAAKVIRERAEAAAPLSGWTVRDIESWACDGSWIMSEDTRLANHIAGWNPKTAEAVASLLEVAAEDIMSAEIRGASWARWEWTHYCFAIAAQVLSEETQT